MCTTYDIDRTRVVRCLCWLLSDYSTEDSIFLHIDMFDVYHRISLHYASECTIRQLHAHAARRTCRLDRDQRTGARCISTTDET